MRFGGEHELMLKYSNQQEKEAKELEMMNEILIKPQTQVKIKQAKLGSTNLNTKTTTTSSMSTLLQPDNLQPKPCKRVFGFKKQLSVPS